MSFFKEQMLKEKKAKLIKEKITLNKETINNFPKKSQPKIKEKGSSELILLRKEKVLREKYSSWKHKQLWEYAKNNGLKHIGRTNSSILLEAIIRKELYD